MAARSLFLSIRRRVTAGHSCDEIRLRSLSSDAVSTETQEDPIRQSDDDLKSRIFRLRLPKRSATNIIQKWVNEGNSITLSDLRHISRELRRSHRYKHALEITEWMVSHEEFKLSDSDYAVRIDLVNKVFGIDAAEQYFEGLPHVAKTSQTYTALLHSYASAKFTDKAEELFHRIKDSGLSLSVITYNEMMTLYMSVGQLEKISSVIEELKSKKIAPDLFTYNLWISSCAAALDIDGVRSILVEMSRDTNSEVCWIRYQNLVNIYFTTGPLTSSGADSLVEANKSITQREWITYDFLLMLHAALGNKDMIDQIWKSLGMTGQKMTGRNYIAVISSYLMLGNMKEVGQVLDQWKSSTSSVFDGSLCGRLVDAFSEVGFMEEAQRFYVLLKQRIPNCSDYLKQ